MQPKFTGRPSRRSQPQEPEAMDEAEQPSKLARARKRFRQIAEAANPSPFIVVVDTRGRPRHQPRHTNLKA
jgi:hypothetical protein